MKRILLSAGLLLAVGSLAAQTVTPGVITPGSKVIDAKVYADIPTTPGMAYRLENKWLYSVATSNFPGGPGLGADARNMAYANGKIYVADRLTTSSGPGLYVFNAETGEPIGTRMDLPELFKKADGTYATYPNNTIRTDAAGNLVFINMVLNIQVNPFQVWTMANENAPAKKILDFAFGDLGDAAMRVDFASVYGDLTSGKAYVIAAISGDDATVAKRIYRFDFTDGVFQPANEDGDPARIDIKSYFPTTAKTNTTAPFIYPIATDKFYFDTAGTAPALYNMSGDMLESFADAPEGTVASHGLANGVAEFVVNGETFLVAGAGTTEGDVKHAFYLYNMGEDASFTAIENLFTFPQTMGAVGNAVRVVLPIVNQVDENTAEIYVYAYKNGLAKYTFAHVPTTGIGEEVTNGSVELVVVNNQIKATEEVKSLEVFAVTGQKVAAVNASSVDVPAAGVYIVKVVNLDGATSAQKVLVK